MDFVFNVRLSNPVDVPVTLRSDTSDGTATSNPFANGVVLEQDFDQITNQIVTFVAGDQFEDITIVVHGEDRFEDDEFFLVLLSELNAMGRDVTVTDGTGIGTILYDDVNPDGAFGQNVYIRGVGTIDDPTATDTFNLRIDQGADTTEVGFLVTAQPGSTLDPAAVRIFDEDGNAVPVSISQATVPASDNRVRNSDSEDTFPTGVEQSLVVAPLRDGFHTVEVFSENGTAGVYQIDVLLPGDIDETDAVTIRSIELAAAAVLQSQLGGDDSAFSEFLDQRGIDINSDQYLIELDANRDGSITNLDLPILLTNAGMPDLQLLFQLDRPPNSQMRVTAESADIDLGTFSLSPVETLSSLIDGIVATQSDTQTASQSSAAGESAPLMALSSSATARSASVEAISSNTLPESGDGQSDVVAAT